MMKHPFTVLIIGCWLMATSGATGTTRTWSGSGGNGDWFAAANWSPDDNYPQADDVITIAGGASVILSNDTASLTSITVTNATLTFTNWQTTLVATDVEIRNGGKLALPFPFDYSPPEMSNRVHVVCTDLIVAAGGQINADAGGYAVTQGPGEGMGGGNRNSGGGHGGRGGDEDATIGGVPYDSTNAPSMPGSGGGKYSASSLNTNGCGGGVVRIEATGAVTVDGTISADGSTGNPYDGGGSGGAIHITCATFGGSGGLVSADGGDGGLYYGGGGGGGGRIAIEYGAVSGSPTVRFTTTPGPKHTSVAAGMGTLWLSDAVLVAPATLGQHFNNVRLFIPGFTSWNIDSLTLTNTMVGMGETGGFTLTVTNDLTIGSDAWLAFAGAPQSAYQMLPSSGPATNPVINVGGSLKIDGGGLSLGVAGSLGIAGSSSKVLLDVGSHLVVTNGGRLDLVSGVTNAADANGAHVTVVGDLRIAAGAWVYLHSHPTNGGSARFDVGNVVISAGGGIDANGSGYKSEGTDVYGPGKGVSAGNRGGGAGYGGVGGRGDNASAFGGATYGATNAPRDAGSGGGYGYAPGPGNAWGGGSIQIDAADVTLNGTLSANGDTAATTYGGGGSGGGVLIVCDAFSGSGDGLVSVNGGNGGAVSGGGGGGRVAIAVGLSAENRTNMWAGQAVADLTAYSVHSGYGGTFAATNGNGNYSPYAQPGTWRFVTVFTGSTFPVAIQSDPGPHDSPTPDGYGTKVGVDEGTWLTNSVTSPADTANGQRWVCLGWALSNDVAGVDSGLTTQSVFEVTTNLFLTWLWTNQYELGLQSDPNGSVNSNALNGWYTNAVGVSGIVPTASGGYAFYEWTGDPPAGQEAADPLSVTMDQARTIRANFASITGQTKTWTGAGNWEDYANWAPPGMPGPRDDVIIQSGSVLLDKSRNVMSLVVSNTATLVFTNWSTALTVSNDVVLRTGGTITTPGIFTESQMSNCVHLVCSDLTVETGAAIDVSAKGFKVWNGPGKGSGSGSNNGSGAGHGGVGGDGIGFVGGPVYGRTNAPVQPGSGGGGGYNQVGGHGGGAVWIDASGAVVVDGTINADAYVNGSSYNGGGSGGSVFVLADTFSGAAGASITADGGDRGTGYPNNLGAGAGGRIAVAIGLDASDRADLKATGTFADIATASSHASYLGAATVAAGLGAVGHTAEDGSLVFLISGAAQNLLTIQGDPGNYGTPLPNDYGDHVYTAGATVTNSVSTPASELNGQRWLCMGWDVQTNGISIGSGTSTQAVFNLDEDATLTWHWTNQYYLAVASGGGGTVNSGTVDGWYTNGVSVAGIAPSLAANHAFLLWYGDVPDAASTNNPLTVMMDQARDIRAAFSATIAGPRSWSGTGPWYEGTNWSPASGVAGALQDVTVVSGNMFIDRVASWKSVVVTNGATLTFTNWSARLTASDTVNIRDGATVTLPGPFIYGTQMSNRIHIVCRDFLLEANGLIDAAEKGYRTHTGPGKGTGTGSNHGAGGGYGGRGGDSDSGVGGPTYGSTNAPLDPGSGGGGTYNMLHGHGGGAVRIEASGQAVVNGSINADGENGGAYNGGGAGGSIFISCGTFEGAGSGALTADGGNRGTGYTALGGGGGGRIAVWHGVPADRYAGIADGSNMTRATVTNSHLLFLGSALVAGGLGGHDGDPGTLVFISVSPPQGTMILIR